MGFEGFYKAVKAAKMIEGQGLVYEDIDKVLAETTSAGERHMLEQTMRSLLMVDELARICYVMEIPENTPAEEIEKAKSRGMNVTDDGRYLITRTEDGKIEDDELYMYDKTKMLTGAEWIKVSTEVEGELNLITVIYNRI